MSVRDGVLVAAGLLVVAGVALAWIPAAFVVAGVLLAAFVLLSE